MERDFMLERRSQPRSSRKSRKKTVVASSRSFSRLLSRCLRAFERSGRDFTLSSISVLEVDAGALANYRKAHSRLETTLVDRLLGEIRAEDRLYQWRPGRYLVLMPDTTMDNAIAALDRIGESLGSLEIELPDDNNRNLLIRPSSEFVAVGPTDFERCSVENLLDAVGYVLEPSGSVTASSEKHQSRSLPGTLFSGEAERWGRRFKEIEIAVPGRWRERSTTLSGYCVRSCEALDSWSRTGNAVNVLAIEPNQELFQDTDELLTRLRTVQHLEHPGLAKLIDFHLDSNEVLYLVYPRGKGMSLDPSTCFSVVEREAVAALICEWMHSISSVLSYLSSLVPPVVPACFDDLLLRLSAAGDRPSVLVSGHDLRFISEGASEDHDQSLLISGLAAFGSSLLEQSCLSGVDSEPCELKHVIDNLGEGSFKLNNLARIKSKFKELTSYYN